MINSRFFNRSELLGFLSLALLLFVILPLFLDVFRLNLVAKYLTYAFVALGLVLFIVTLLLNIIALAVVKRYREAYD